MQHEVLLALMGHCGDVIVNTGSSFALAADISFLSASERVVVNRLVCVGHTYLKLARFVEVHAEGACLHRAPLIFSHGGCPRRTH